MKTYTLVAALMLSGLASTLSTQEAKPATKATDKTATETTAAAKPATTAAAKPATTAAAKPAIKAAADSKTTAAAKGEKPTESPGWIIIEEDWYFPLRFDSLVSMNNARLLYRKHEEQAAASELRRAITWLKFAESHAEPITKSKLTIAASELSTLADDLDQGKLRDAAAMESSLSRASAALAEWHYFKARESWGQSDEKYAAQYLQAAVAHLKHAAGSAHYQYGPDTVTVFDQITQGDATTSVAETFDHNVLGKHLDGIETAVQEMSDHLMKAGK